MTGFLATLLVGMLGGFIAEAIRVAAAFREDKPPARNEWIASLLHVLLGGGVVLYGWEDERALLELATMGAAFPLLFSAAVRATTDPKQNGRQVPRSSTGNASRRLVDYLAGRFS